MVRTLLLMFAAAVCQAQTPPAPLTFPGQTEGDWVIHDFTFHTGEKLAELRIHYTTAGKPTRDEAGRVNNAVIIMHGTGGSGRAFLSAAFGGELFREGQPLDAATHYIILPDDIGHGKSSKPSDGLRSKFPHYDYEDMVRAEYALVHDGLHVDHMRLVMGTSMGAMHTWIWGEMYPDFMDALMPLASAPVEIAGRNRMFRAMVIQAIRNDPEWKNGEYTKPPEQGLVAAQYALWMMTSSALQLHKANPTSEKADAAVAALRQRATRTDANDMLYYSEASTDYNPSPNLEKIKAPLYAVNSADDEVNPPELGILERRSSACLMGATSCYPPATRPRPRHAFAPGGLETVPRRAVAGIGSITPQRSIRKGNSSARRTLKGGSTRYEIFKPASGRSSADKIASGWICGAISGMARRIRFCMAGHRRARHRRGTDLSVLHQLQQLQNLLKSLGR